MHPRALWASGDIGLHYQRRITSQALTNRLLKTCTSFNSTSKVQRPWSERVLHTSTLVCHYCASTCYHTDSIKLSQSNVTPAPIDPAVDPVFIARPPQLPVRHHLEKWQLQYGGPTEETLSAFEKHPANGEIVNTFSKVSSASAVDEQTEGDRWFAGEDDEGEDLITIGLFLKPGDVVELSCVSFHGSTRKEQSY